MAAIISICAYVGIDPGATTGVCYLDRDARAQKLDKYNWLKLGAFKIYQAIVEEMETIIKKNDLDYTPDQAFVIIIEQAVYGWKYAFNAGQSRERSAGLIMLFKDAGFTVIVIQPKNRWTKWDRRKFNAYFKWTGSSNNHNRDAGCHAFRGMGEYQKLLMEARAGSRCRKRKGGK